MHITGTVQTFTAPVSGWYQIECWGALGTDWRGQPTPSIWTHPDYNPTVGAGYTKGEIFLSQLETIYVYVGEGGFHQTDINALRYGFNGGGYALGGYDVVGAKLSYGGGGATDVRLIGGSWSNSSGIESRLIVAGGSGGGHCSTHMGGGAGGLYGYNGYNYITNEVTGYGAGQTSNHSGRIFQKGIGGCTTAYGCGAGGGGYYGGTADVTGRVAGSGGGGSSYISGYPGCPSHYSGRTFRNNSISGANLGTDNRDSSFNGYARFLLTERG